MGLELPSDFGRYRLLRLLGRGGMAEVFLADDAGRPVAIKRLLPHYAAERRFARMLRDEARIGAAIRHPNVVGVIDAGVVEGVHYLAMEYVDGVDLARILRDLGTHGRYLPVAAALYVACRVAEGLHAAHGVTDENGVPLCVTHRDVSPHNVLISFDGEVKLIDFGVAKAITNRTHTRSGVIKGKLQYMSPEQAQARAIDARSDVFSLGLTLYKMLTGRLPFTGANEFQIYEQILRCEATPPRLLRPEVSEVVDALVLRSLRKRPERRFASAAEMAAVAGRVLDGIAPGFDAADLAACLADALRATPDDDETVAAPADVGANRPEPLPPAPPEDESRVDMLTRWDLPSPEPQAPPPSAPPQAIPVGPPSPSVVSVRTHELRGLRRRSTGLAVALAGAGALCGAAVLALDNGTAPARGGEAEAVALPVRVAAPDAAPPAVPVALVEPRPDPASVPAPSRVAEPAPAPAPATASPRRDAPPAGPGFVTITALPWAWVEVDGRTLDQQTPITRLPLKPGRHTVRLSSPDRTASVERVIDVRAGRGTQVSHQFP